MSKRLHVVLEVAEYRDCQRAARALGLTLPEWIRQALRAALRGEPTRDIDRKLEVIRAAARHAFPTADINQMLAEVERGYLDTGER